jgi:polysaccharide biosynthesis/export protein
MTHQTTTKQKPMLLAWIVALALSSCTSIQQIAYFQDEPVGTEQKMDKSTLIKIKPLDQLSIIVSSKDPQLAALFNLPHVQQTAGQSAESGTGNQRGELMGYTVDSNGNIDFPVLGELSIEGLSREEIARTIKNQLIDKNLVNDPVVTVEFVNLHFSVLGEVAKPGQFSIGKDRVTLTEALSMAGDLTIYGKRDHILLTRLKSDDTRITYRVDLRSTGVYHSPAYFVQQNDVIYVQPNDTRANQSTVNGNNIRSVSLWMSVASLLTTLGVILFN